MGNTTDELQPLLRGLNLSATADGPHAAALRAAKEGSFHKPYLLELGGSNWLPRRAGVLKGCASSLVCCPGRPAHTRHKSL